jgi:uncharacterized paraquat-inducible protein A
MSHLVSRILLAVLMLPAASLIFIVTIIAAEKAFGYQYRPLPMVMAGFCTWVFVAMYWYGLWRGSVRWTQQRVMRTFLAAGVCIAAGLMSGLLIYSIENDVGQFVGCVTAPLLWLIAATLIWRETPRERAARMKGTSKFAIVCPKCGYNLTGLQSTRCPECGTQYTLDELLMAQPSAMAADDDAVG